MVKIIAAVCSTLAIIILTFKYSEKLEHYFIQAGNLYYKVARGIGYFSSISIYFCYSIGKLFVVAIFLISVVAFLNEMLITFDILYINEFGFLSELLTVVSKDSNVWVASSAILAATVAFGHFKTLDIKVQEKYEKENEQLLSSINNFINRT